MSQLLFSGAVPGPADVRGVRAVLGVLDLDTGDLLHRCEYRSPRARPGHKMQFTGFHREGEQITVCTHTELVRYDSWPPREPSGTISIPGFNDLHHCLPWSGALAVANTGLETVDLVSEAGDLLERWDLAPQRGQPIDPERDLRLLADTKPHLVHANHLFSRAGELWVTQLRTARAHCVTASTPGLGFETGRPHDGSPVDGLLTFTTTNGRLVRVDPETMSIGSDLDLEAATPGNSVLGWCRGVAPDPDFDEGFWVGFSFPRPSRWKEYAFKFKHREQRLPSRVSLYDAAARRLVRSVPLIAGESLVVFQLEALPRELWI